MLFLYFGLLACVGFVVAGSVAYLLLLLCAALASRSRRASGGEAASRVTALGKSPRVTVIIPAHNEELVLAATLKSLKAQEYPAHLTETVVIADNCTDRTAEIARIHGATVLERFDRNQRGKGYALEWALSQLLSRDEVADAFMFVDADTWVDPDFVTVMVTRLQSGGELCALQGRYGVLNGVESWRAALMAAAFDLVNHVRPLGQDRLGFSVGLKGNGMAFTRRILEEAPWRGHSITEDIDYGLDLLIHHGARVAYAPDARVLAQMPVTAEQATSQRERWEGGRYRLVRERVASLLGLWVRRRDARCLDAACALLALPLAELVAALLLWGVMIGVGQAGHWLPAPLAWDAAFAVCAAGLAVYVFAGLAAAGAPRAAYQALANAPFYAAWKLALYAVGLFRRLRKGSGTSPEWVRTARAPIDSGTAPEYRGSPD